MRFEIDAQPEGGLQVIPDIPHYAMCRVEGANGIGKTLAIRVLQLCCGVQPYEDPHLWQTLRDGLGDVAVRVGQLRDGQSIEWNFDTRNWPRQIEEPEDGWFTSIRVDGKPASLKDIRQLLFVVRIDGSETLNDAIAGRIRQERTSIVRSSRNMRQYLDAWDTALTQLDADLRRVNVQRMRSARKQLQDSRRRLDELEVHRNAVRDRLDGLERLSTVARAVRELDEEAPALEQERRQIDSHIATLATRIADLDRRIEAQRPRLQARSDLVRRIREQERVVERRGRLRASTSSRVETLASTLAVPAERAEVEARQRLENETIRAAADARAHLDKTPLVDRASVDVGLRLEAAVAQGLADEVIAEIDETEVAIGELAQGITRRREVLRRQPVGEEVRRLTTEIARLTHRQEQFAELLRLLQRLGSNERSFREAQAQLTDLRGRLGGPDAGEFNRLVDELGTARQEANDLHARRAVVTHQLSHLAGGATRAELLEELMAGLTTNDVASEELEATIVDLNQLLSELEQERDSLSQEVTSLQVIIQEELSGLRTASRVVSSDAAYEWIRSFAGHLLPRPEQAEDDQLLLLERWTTAVASVQARLEQLRNDAEAISVVLDRLAQHVHSNQGRVLTDHDDLRYFSEVRSWMGEVLARQFSGPEIAGALFDGGVIVDVDLDDMAVVWDTENGERRRRPIEAFSSGEKAFAFTLARLETVDFLGARNRLAVLDEFGAYVDYERMGQLVEILQTNVLNTKADQIVVIVPLSRSYSNAAPTVSAEISEQLEQTSYFAADLTVAL